MRISQIKGKYRNRFLTEIFYRCILFCVQTAQGLKKEAAAPTRAAAATAGAIN
jgi:hypothetical protein